MKSKVTFVDLTVYKNIIPLLFGYLQTYACKDLDIKDFYSFETYSTTVQSLPSKILQELQKKDSLVFAFSCYMWNMGLVSYLITALQKSKPDSYFILGGPQVIKNGESYLNAQYKNVLVCNGEGEITFSNILKELMKSKPDFSKVRGLTFFKEQELITTEKEEQIKDLDEIPSPFQNNIFPKGLYSYTVFETNRSCPFECSFCFWGAEAGKLSKFSDQRVKKDLKWISQNMIFGIFMADANWGILKRDIEFSQTMADNKKSYGNPIFVAINSAKNQPDRLIEMAKIFQDSGMLSSHSIPLQTLSPNALAIANRKSIPIEGYVKLQEKMFERKLNSFIELIWPLPGETLTSFFEGINKLCSSKAECIFPYPFSLLVNTEFYKRRKEYGIVTKRAPVQAGEVDLVITTNDVSYSEYQEGLYFSFALYLLYNARGLYYSANYLSQKKILTFSGFFRSFVEFCKKNENLPIIEFHKKSIEDFSYYQLIYVGKIIYYTLHSCRDEFDEILYKFCSEQVWWNDDDFRALFEIDLMNRPFVFSTTSLQKKNNFKHLKIKDVLPDGYIVDVPVKYHDFIHNYQRINNYDDKNSSVLKIKCIDKQFPFMEVKSIEEHADYCHGLMINVRNILPVWSKI